MGHETSKLKNSKRRFQDENAIKKQIKIAKVFGYIKHKIVEEPHRLIKHHALNCGNPKCVMCGNPRKIFKKITTQEKRFVHKEKSQIEDINSDE